EAVGTLAEKVGLAPGEREQALFRRRVRFDRSVGANVASAPVRRAPGRPAGSCETGTYGPPVRVKPGDVVEDGEIVARDPDPNIRTQLEREYSPGGYNEC